MEHPNQYHQSVHQPVHPPANQHPKKSEGLKSIFATIGILLLAPVVAILLTMFVFQSYEVDGPSMESTLQNKDRLIVYKLPRTIASITNKTYQPNRGDIVVFTRKGTIDYNNTENKQLIKRVIGVPGDRVVIRDGTVTIYNAEHPDGFNPDEGQPYAANNFTTPGNVDITVKEGEVFVMGDNRHNSLDSRAFGTVQDKHIVGVLALRVYPFSKVDAY
ncbi:signal peptidase I [Candidatus Saccharibacteria bacterium]|nr:signal peptidase I [Candidatus Saccharibacteria bacterium]